VNFIIMQFSLRFVYLNFTSKYPAQHSVLKTPQCVFLSQSERPSFARIQHKRQIKFLCILILRFLDMRREEESFWTEY